ncbi:hypothetical protein BDP81DRAFT_468195 [Colletotrichum phormii]|uniref:Uncharacterized protein n=1 Tax=Colletotrichum phormii TaxID=359342 RepID=A0AAJ0EKP6_9PEZI|nr:uncharacterized protein BDP81DRAFT_468195 [Colletotrichum phormii]KAK1654797.1 hypothetical protein BDP81DRAFT_468195 [Colletotrichum phormii]
MWEKHRQTAEMIAKVNVGPSDTIKTLSVCLTFDTDHERSMDHEGQLLITMSRLSTEDSGQQLRVVKSGGRGETSLPSPLAARARSHNDAPTSQSLPKAPTPGQWSSFGETLSSSIYRLEDFLILTSTSFTRVNLIRRTQHKYRQPVVSNRVQTCPTQLVFRCARSCQNWKREAHVLNLWIKAHNKHERTNTHLGSIHRGSTYFTIRNSPSGSAILLLVALSPQSSPRNSAR